MHTHASSEHEQPVIARENTIRLLVFASLKYLVFMQGSYAFWKVWNCIFILKTPEIVLKSVTRTPEVLLGSSVKLNYRNLRIAGFPFLCLESVLSEPLTLCWTVAKQTFTHIFGVISKYSGKLLEKSLQNLMESTGYSPKYAWKKLEIPKILLEVLDCQNY